MNYLLDWGDGPVDFSKEYNRKREDAEHQTAIAFVKHIKELIAASTQPNAKSIQISQKELYKNFIYPQIAKDAWLNGEKRNFAEAEQGHSCAIKKGLIEIDYGVRPYEYILLDIAKESFELRPYQKYIIDDTTNEKGSVLIEAPTGSGKSVMANEIAKNEVGKGGIVLIVAPKIILLEQLQETFSLLKPQIIHGPNDYNREHSVFISTIQTAHKRDLGFNPTMILIDEVHFGFSGKMIRQLLSEFEGRLIGLSATPYDERGVPLQGFDLHINKYNLKYMLANNYLVHPKCYAPMKVDLSRISLVGGDYNQSELDSQFNNLDSITQIVESTKDVILKRKASLVFCINIAHSEAMAQAFTNSGIATKAIHSKLSKEEQKQIMDEYKSGKLKMLANPMMLTTGFDHPITDTIIFARATKSQNLYRQMVGRALRLSENKKDAVILDCSNVIANLGLPTQDIKEMDNSLSKSMKVCSECESEKLYKKIVNNKAYIYCADCGHYEISMQQGYECEACGLVHTNHSKFIMRDNCLFLVCDDCGYESLVSEESSKEEMQLIFDATLTNELQIKTTIKYFQYLMKNYSPEFIFKEEVLKHAKALQALVVKEPDLFMSLEDRSFEFKKIVQQDTSNKIKYNWESVWKLNNIDKWRIFDEAFEDEILNDGLKDLHKYLESSQSLKNTIDLIQSILKLKNEEIMKISVIEKLLQDVKKSKVKDIDMICNKRLKDLYFNKQSLDEIEGFIQIMESVLI